MLFSIALRLFSALVPLVTSAQLPSPVGLTPADAEKAYASQNWSEAESEYMALSAKQPDNARFWYRLAVSARANRHYDVALQSMQKAKSLGVGRGLPPSLADYEIATIYAAMGNDAEALSALKTSADAGFLQPSRLESDSEWDGLRTNDEFTALAKQVQHNATPCEDPEFKQFDFWVGDWAVSSASDGTPRGSSHISKEMGGCVLWENWVSIGSPYFGKSYNTWNPNLKRWEQYWVDNSAGTMFFHGNLKDNFMDYWTDDVPQSAGGTLLRHLQFFNLGPDRVRQFSQGSTDGGKTWHTEYDLIYTRTKAKPAQATESN